MLRGRSTEAVWLYGGMAVFGGGTSKGADRGGGTGEEEEMGRMGERGRRRRREGCSVLKYKSTHKHPTHTIFEKVVFLLLACLTT